MTGSRSRMTVVKSLFVATVLIPVVWYQVDWFGQKAALSVPWTFAITFLLFHRSWKWKVEAVYLCFALGILGGFYSGAFIRWE